MELAMENRELMWKELIEELPSKVDEACTAIMQILMADGYLHLKWPMPMEHFERIAGRLGTIVLRSDVKVDLDRARPGNGSVFGKE